MSARDAAVLALLFAVVTAAGIALIWGIALATGGTAADLIKPSCGIAGGSALCYLYTLWCEL